MDPNGFAFLGAWNPEIVYLYAIGASTYTEYILKDLSRQYVLQYFDRYYDLSTSLPRVIDEELLARLLR